MHLAMILRKHEVLGVLGKAIAADPHIWGKAAETPEVSKLPALTKFFRHQVSSGCGCGS
jgi:hypothetical protein